MTTPNPRTTRASRRSARRSPAILRPDAPTPRAPTRARPQAVRDQVRLRPRWISAPLCVLLLVAMTYLWGDPRFTVGSIAIAGATTVSAADIVALTEIAGERLLSVSPSVVRARLLTSPAIADASVTVGFPPNAVQIVIQERQPVLVWGEGDAAVWIDLQGRTMAQRAIRDDLLRLRPDALLDAPPGERIDPAIVIGAIQLTQLLPTLTTLEFHPDKGLGYNDPRGWAIWLGTGDDMAEKLLIYDAIVRRVGERGITPAEIVVNNPDAPYYSTLRRR